MENTDADLDALIRATLAECWREVYETILADLESEASTYCDGEGCERN